ncbi:hypothetical protein H5410_001155 [Solanum commersonii]|uniref:CCHC-type domain-containing protein n=1 Tax=Solanum commersonii TaxID=4109 RepID=A0A9J6AY48_SOLCO|nr:hypothetical protein H5410_001155 [Solanum commersonii]
MVYFVFGTIFYATCFDFRSQYKRRSFLLHPNKVISFGDYLLGFEPQENKYKVFLSETQRGETQSIFSSLPYGKPSICINGVIHQFVRAHKCAIAAFDVKFEKLEIITLWNESYWVCAYQLIEVKGKLAVVDHHRKRRIIQFPSKWNYRVPGPISSCTSRDGKIVFICNFKSGALCWCYDVIAMRRRWRKLEIKVKQRRQGNDANRDMDIARLMIQVQQVEEDKLKDREDFKNKKAKTSENEFRQQKSSANGAPAPENKSEYNSQNSQSFTAKPAYSQGSMAQKGSKPPAWAKYGRNHSGICCEGFTSCFKCGQNGHFMRKCPENMQG